MSNLTKSQLMEAITANPFNVFLAESLCQLINNPAEEKLMITPKDVFGKASVNLYMALGIDLGKDELPADKYPLSYLTQNITAQLVHTLKGQLDLSQKEYAHFPDMPVSVSADNQTAITDIQEENPKEVVPDDEPKKEQKKKDKK